MNHKTGEVTLGHAGPNSISNHQKIEYQFNKSHLDLSKLDFIHLSAGSQDVPIRNLTIQFQPIPDLHPSFDKDFKIDTSALIKTHHSYPYSPSNPVPYNNHSANISSSHRAPRRHQPKKISSTILF